MRSIARSPNSTSSSGNISIAASPTGASPTGKEKAKEYAPLLARIEKDYGVERSVMLGLWGIESAFGDPDVQKNHMRPVIPALAALAWGEPRRRAYWEQELLNALVIIDRGWGTPEEMRGSWAGAMGHTQWMPEVWLNVGVDYDGDGRASPFGKPDDALAGTAQYLVKRGKYRPGEHWGYEVRGVSGTTSGRRVAQLRGLAEGRRDARRRQAVPAAGRDREALGAGAGRAGLPARAEFLCGALLQPVDELHALRSCISATASWAAGRSCSRSPAASARRRSPRCRRSRSA